MLLLLPLLVLLRPGVSVAAAAVAGRATTAVSVSPSAVVKRAGVAVFAYVCCCRCG